MKKWLNRKNEEAVSPVIAVILMVAITVVLAAVLYVMVSGMMEETKTTPTGALNFTQVGSADVNGFKTYSGGLVSLSRDVDFVDVSMTIVNGTASSASAGVEGCLTTAAVVAGTPAFSVTYSDTNANGKLDSGDVFSVSGASSGDQMKLVFIPSGGEIGSKTF